MGYRDDSVWQAAHRRYLEPNTGAADMDWKARLLAISDMYVIEKQYEEE